MAEYTGDENDLGLDNVFEEPPRPPTPPPTFTTYNRQAIHLESQCGTTPEWSSIDLKLVGHHVLWAQHLWNAAIVLANFLDDNSSDICQDKAVLELGAGGALPSLVAALCGAHQVVITDYPDSPLLDNITRNVDRNIPSKIRSQVAIQGYVWGTDPGKLFRWADCTRLAGESEDAHVVKQDAFDVIILSDLIFNHSQHSALLDTCELALRPAPRPGVTQSKMKLAGDDPFASLRRKRIHSNPKDPKKLNHEGKSSTMTTPCVLVFFSHHRPQYATRDMAFFALAKDRGWICEQVVQTKMKAMFPDDPGDEDVRSTVHGWVLRRSASITS